MSREEVSAERLRHIQIASAETEGKNLRSLLQLLLNTGEEN